MSKSPKLTSEEITNVKSHQRLAAHVVYETVRQEGEDELARPAASLVWSGIAAGMGISFSLVAEGLLHIALPEAPWRPLIQNFGYCVGFIIVVLGRQQLFTENTITVVLPVLANRTRKNYFALMRLWAIVFAANMAGTFILAVALTSGLFFPPGAMDGFLAVSVQQMELGAEDMFFRAIVAGWLIATMVWLLPSAKGAEIWVVTIVTYVIALADLAHVIAGSAEAFFLVFMGERSPVHVLFVFMLPSLAGNMIGGTALFAMISYAQVREEI